MSTATAVPARTNRGPDDKSSSPPRPAPARKFNGNFQKSARGKGEPKPEADILFQTYFKSVGPRTYAAQVKRAGNGNHFVVLTEGKRDDKTGEIRKMRLFVFSEDFTAFFKMLHEAAVFIRENPVPDDVKKKREKFWAKNGDGASPQKHPGQSPSSTPRSGQGPANEDARGRGPVQRSAPRAVGNNAR